MDENIPRRIETKLDIIIGLPQDRILTVDEIALLSETDEIVRNRDYQNFVKL
jgi:hypothetical protein